MLVDDKEPGFRARRAGLPAPSDRLLASRGEPSASWEPDGLLSLHQADALEPRRRKAIHPNFEPIALVDGDLASELVDGVREALALDDAVPSSLEIAQRKTKPGHVGFLRWRYPRRSSLHNASAVWIVRPPSDELIPAQGDNVACACEVGEVGAARDGELRMPSLDR